MNDTAQVTDCALLPIFDRYGLTVQPCGAALATGCPNSHRWWPRHPQEDSHVPYILRWEGHGVYRRFFGVVSSAEFREAYEEMTADLRYQCIRYIISDYLEAVPGPDLTATFMGRVERLARLEYECGPDIVHATVASGEEMLAHVRYFESQPLAPYPEATFASPAAARTWIASNPRPAWRSASPPARHPGPADMRIRRESAREPEPVERAGGAAG